MTNPATPTAMQRKLIVVGAGPVGLLLALMLSQHGIAVDVLEAGPSIDTRPRGLGYGPAAVRVLRRAGILDEIRELGITYRSFAWRKLDGELLGEIDVTGDPDATVCLPVDKLAEFLLTKLPGCVTVHWNHRVTAAGSDEKGGWVEVDVKGEQKRFVADFVVGCDGAKSVVRHCVHGRNFPGKTWDQQIVALNIYYDLHKHGWSDCQWTIDPQNWSIICRIDKDPTLWRIAYADKTGLSQTELHERVTQKLETILPGSPKPEDYNVVRFSPYTMHNRCVEHLKVGRVLLAGDSAHLCNPMGGLGLTGHVATVGSLVDALVGVYDGKASMAILDKFDEGRREVFHSVIDRLSSENLERLKKSADTVAAEDAFIKGLASKDPSTLAEVEKGNNAIGLDMTFFYNN